MREWSAGRIAQAAGARLIAESSTGTAPSSIGTALPTTSQQGPARAVIDSREVGRDDLFVGLCGERTDGGEYGAQALNAGAWGVLVAQEHAERALAAALAGPGGAVLVHDDPLSGPADACTRVAPGAGGEGHRSSRSRARLGRPRQRTSSRRVLGKRRRTVASRENLNTEIGLPLSVLAAPGDTEMLVLEMAMRGAGQIAELARIAEPDVGVIVNVGPVHLELLGSLAAIAAAKAELIVEMVSGATVVVPADEPLLEPVQTRGHGHGHVWGRAATSSWWSGALTVRW